MSNKDSNDKDKDLTLIKWFIDWRKPIQSWLRRKRSIPAGYIDDLSQEVFLRLLRYDSKEIVENPSSYLFTIASNVAAEWRQRCAQRKPHDDSWLETLLCDETQQPDSLLEDVQFKLYLQSIIDTKLSPRCRAILLMHVNGKTYNQIGAELNVSYRLVLREIVKAYATLRRELTDDDNV